MKLINDFGCDYYAEVEFFGKRLKGYIAQHFSLDHNFCVKIDGTLFSYDVKIAINNGAYSFLSDATIRKIANRLINDLPVPGFFFYAPSFVGGNIDIMTSRTHKCNHHYNDRLRRNTISVRYVNI